MRLRNNGTGFEKIGLIIALLIALIIALGGILLDASDGELDGVINFFFILLTMEIK